MTIEHRIRYYLEASRSAPLYHWMVTKKVVGCLANDEIVPLFRHEGMNKHGISLSRNTRFDFGSSFYGASDHFVRLTLDQDKLAREHKITPLDAEHAVRKRGYNREDDGYRPDRDKCLEDTLMAEEYLIGTIKPLHKYVTSVYLKLEDLYLNAVHSPSMDDDEDLVRYHSEKRARFVNIATAVYKFCSRWKIRLTVDDEAKWHAFLKELPNLN